MFPTIRNMSAVSIRTVPSFSSSPTTANLSDRGGRLDGGGSVSFPFPRILCTPPAFPTQRLQGQCLRMSLSTSVPTTTASLKNGGAVRRPFCVFPSPFPVMQAIYTPPPAQQLGQKTTQRRIQRRAREHLLQQL